MPTTTGAVPVRSASARRSRSARGHPAGQQHRREPGGRQEGVERAQVLLGERLGGHEQRRLGARLDRLAHREHRDEGLAGAHLPLQQAAHRAGRGRGRARSRAAARRCSAVSVNGSAASSGSERSPVGARTGAAPVAGLRAGAPPRARAGAPAAPRRPAGGAQRAPRGASAGSARPRARRRRPAARGARGPTRAGAPAPRAPAAGRGRPARGCAAPASARWPGRPARGPGCGGPRTRRRRAPRGVRTAISAPAPSVPTAPAQQQLVAGLQHPRQVLLVEPGRAESSRVASRTRARTRRRPRRRVGRTEMSSSTTRTVDLLPRAQSGERPDVLVEGLVAHRAGAPAARRSPSMPRAGRAVAPWRGPTPGSSVSGASHHPARGRAAAAARARGRPGRGRAEGRGGRRVRRGCARGH